MPAPVSAASRMPWNGTAAEPPPPPAPSLLESIPAAIRSSVDAVHFQQERRLGEAYMAVEEALNEAQGRRPATLNSALDALNYGAFFGEDRRRAVWDRLAKLREQGATLPQSLAAIPPDREAFDRQTVTRGGQYQADAQVAARGGVVPQLIGGVAASFTDPVNLIGGAAAGKLINSASMPLLRGMLLEGAANAALELGQAPDNVQARQKLGENATLNVTDTLVGMGEAFLFGAGLHGLARGTQAGFEKAIAANWERLPQGLRDRWAGRNALNAAEQDRLLADLAEALIGPERMTEAEAGAAAELRRQAEIDLGSPFMANGAGTEAHFNALAERMAQIIEDSPAARTTYGPGARIGGTAEVAAGDAQSRFMAKTRIAESSGNDLAQAATSSAFGRYQFTKGTWLGYYVRRFGTGGLTREQIYAKRADPNLQDVLMADLTADNAARLSGMGAPVTEGNLYLMHLLGPADAEKVLRAGGDTPLEGLINKASIAANRSIMAGKTAADIRAFAARKMGSAGDGGAGLHLNPALDAEAGLRAQMDAELAAVRAEAERLDAELRGRGVDTEALIREAEAADMRDAQPVPVEDIGPDALPRPLAEPRAPLERPIVPNAPAETLAIAEKLKPLINDRARDINDLAGIAAELGVTPEEVRSGLLQLARDKTLVTVRKSDGAFIRRNVPARDLSLIEWIKQGGGIYDGGIGEFKGGDLAAMGLNDWYKGGPFRDKKPIINDSDWARKNRGLDKILRAAVEAGYFPELRGALDATGTDTLDTNNLLRAIDAELRGHGTRYPAGSRSYEKTAQAGGAPAPAPRGDNPYGWDAVLADTFDDLRIAAEGLGMDASLIDQDMVFYAADLRQMNPLMEPGDLFSRVINDIAEANRWDAVDESGDVGYEELDYAWPYTSENPEPRSQAGAAAPDRGGPESIGSDPRTGGPNGGNDGANGQGTPPDLADMPPEEATRFLDPMGDAAKTQIDRLEHDARMAMEAAQTAADSKAAYDRMYVSPQTGEEAARLLWDEQATPEELAQFAAGWEAGKRGDAKPANEDTTFFEGWHVGDRTKTLLAEGVQPMPRGGAAEPAQTVANKAEIDAAFKVWSEAEARYYDGPSIKDALPENASDKEIELWMKGRDAAWDEMKRAQVAYYDLRGDTAAADEALLAVKDRTDAEQIRLNQRGNGGAANDDYPESVGFNWNAANAADEMAAMITKMGKKGPTMSVDQMAAMFEQLPDTLASEELLHDIRVKVWAQAEQDGTLSQPNSPVDRFLAARDMRNEALAPAREAQAQAERAAAVAEARALAQQIAEKVDQGGEMRLPDGLNRRWVIYRKGTVKATSEGLFVARGKRWDKVLDSDIPGIAKAMGIEAKPATLDNGAAVDPNIAAKTRQELDLAAQQRLDGSRKTGRPQDPTMPEGLFGGPVEPTFDLGDGGPPKTMKDLLSELDADEADNATIRSCMVPKPGAGE